MTEKTPSNFQIIPSQEDASVNFVRPGDRLGFFEARYVRRTDDYFIVYLSSQTGCQKACRMCHLTATGQNKFENASHGDFISQAETVLKQRFRVHFFNLVGTPGKFDTHFAFIFIIHVRPLYFTFEFQSRIAGKQAGTYF